MTDPNPDTEPETPDAPDTPDTGEADEWTPPDKDAWAKLQKTAERRDKALREAQAKIKELSGQQDKPTEPDKDALANTKILRAEARSVLAGTGITDKDDQLAVLDVLRLDGIDVDDDGEPDTEELEERISKLRKAFGGSAPAARRVPRVDTRDRGGRTAEPADPDKARRLRFLTGRA